MPRRTPMAKQADSQCNSNTSRRKASPPKTTKPVCGGELLKTDTDREMEERRATLVADADATSAFEFISDMENTFIRMGGVVATIRLIVSDDGLVTNVQDALYLLSNILGESLEEAKEM